MTRIYRGQLIIGDIPQLTPVVPVFSTVILNAIYTGAKATLAVSAGKYIIECYGAEGGSANGNSGTSGPGAGGKGAYAKATVTLPDCTLVYAVGEMPLALLAHGGDQVCGGGGGMTAVAIQGASSSTDIPLVVAGAGGGGTETVRGGAVGGMGNGIGGSDTNKGNYGGACWINNGSSYGGISWVNGLAKVTGYTYGGMTSYGGWGGGGGGSDDSGGGGGGGYAGGTGAPSVGGYSFITSSYTPTDITVTAGARYGSGIITITKIA